MTTEPEEQVVNEEPVAPADVAEPVAKAQSESANEFVEAVSDLTEKLVFAILDPFKKMLISLSDASDDIVDVIDKSAKKKGD